MMVTSCQRPSLNAVWRSTPTVRNPCRSCSRSDAVLRDVMRAMIE